MDEKRIILFALRAVLIYVCLMFVLPVFKLDERYLSAVRIFSSSAYSDIGGWGKATFIKKISTEFDTAVIIRRNANEFMKYQWNLRLMTYRPLIVLLSLILAAFIPFKRKIITLVLGIFWLHLLLYILMYFEAWWVNNGGNKIIIHNNIMGNGGLFFIIPAIIAGCLFFSKEVLQNTEREPQT